jgi:hypothetical protein
LLPFCESTGAQDELVTKLINEKGRAIASELHIIVNDFRAEFKLLNVDRHYAFQRDRSRFPEKIKKIAGYGFDFDFLCNFLIFYSN